MRKAPRNANRNDLGVQNMVKMVNGILFTLRALRNSFVIVSAFLIESEFGKFGFGGEGKPEYPEKNLLKPGENHQQTQPTYDAGSGNRTRATLVGGDPLPPTTVPPQLRFQT